MLCTFFSLSGKNTLPSCHSSNLTELLGLQVRFVCLAFFLPFVLVTPLSPLPQNPFQFRVTRKTRHWSREFNRFFSIAGNKWFDWDQRLWDRPKFLLSDETAVSDCNSCFFSLILLLLFPKLANETSVLSFLSVQTNQSFLHSACKNTSWAAASPELLMCVYI